MNTWGKSPALRKSDGRWVWGALAAVIATSVAARSWLLWSTPLIPGRNGGYYLIQARALLEHGALGIPDLPLTFFIQAAVAKLLQLLTGQGLEPSVMLSVRLCDGILPALIAVPVFLLGRGWCARTGRNAWPACAAAAIAAFGAPALSMTGDFEKNSLGLVWLAGLIAALNAWMAQRTRGRAAAVVALLGLCGLTHIGVFGSALLITALTGCADLALLRGRDGLRTLWRIALVAAASAALVAAVAGVVLWKFDPARIRRLAGAASNPIAFLQNGGHTDGPGHPSCGSIGQRAEMFRPPSDDTAGPAFERGEEPPPFARGERPGPGPSRRQPPGMGMRGFPQGAATGAFALLAAGTLALAWFKRRDLSAADRATAIGCGVALIVLTGPWVGSDMLDRFQLIAMVPAACSAAFVLAQMPGRRSASVGAVAVFALLAVTTVPLLRHGGRPVFSTAAFKELQTLIPYVAHPDRTLIVAPHGLEWWAAWVLHTHVAQTRAVRSSDWSKYETVLFLQENQHGGEGFPGGMGDGHPPDMTGRDANRAGHPEPPPEFGHADHRFGPPGGPPMTSENLPDGAETLHSGTYFLLARVSQPISGDEHPAAPDAP